MSQPKKYKAEVVSITNPVENIYTVEFCSKTGRFRYLPGQFMHLALDGYDPSFGWPDSRCFSMQSSPASELLKITFAVKGSFTSRLAEELVVGRTVDLKLPYGELFQNKHSRTNAVFIAGGTGITPFISLFVDPSFETYVKPNLYLGIRSHRYYIYKTELSKAREINSSFRITYKSEDTDGILDIDGIFYENGNSIPYFISGPQKMISSFKSRLIDLGLSEELVITDEWE